MTEQPDDPEPPTVIVPSRRCPKWWLRQPHAAHAWGIRPPRIFRCIGIDATPPPTEQEQPWPPQSPPTPSSQP